MGLKLQDLFMDYGRYYTVRELARLLKVTQATVSRWEKRGIPAKHQEKIHLWVFQQAFNSFLNSLSNKLSKEIEEDNKIYLKWGWRIGLTALGFGVGLASGGIGIAAYGTAIGVPGYLAGGAAGGVVAKNTEKLLEKIVFLT